LAPHQAKPGLLSGGVTSIKEPPVAGFRLPGFKIASRAHSGARKSGLHRIDRDPQTAHSASGSRIGRLGRCCGSAIFSLGIESLRLKDRSVNTKPTQK